MSKYKRYERYKDSGVEWTGEIPEHWELRKIKHIGMLSAGGVNKKIEEGEELFKSVHYMDVYRNSGKVIGNDDDYLVISATQSQAKNCTLKKGDVLFTSSSETPDDIGHAVTISEDLEQTLYGYHLIRLRLNRDIPVDYSYRKYMFNDYYIRNYFSSRAQGITRYGLKYDDYKEAVVFIPPINEQNIIANFLDQKTSKIDGLIADKEKLIELLQEKRQSIISEAVTKGLDKNVPMKDSGVEWTGEIPEHWEVSKVKYEVYINKETLSENTDEEYEIVYIDISSVNSIGQIQNIQEMMFKDAPSRARRIIKNGDTIVSTVRTYLKAIAFCANVGSNYICSTGFAVLTPKGNIFKKYLYYLMRSEEYVNEIVKRSVGVSYPAINATDIGCLECLLPPRSEQEQISNYLDQKTAEIDSLISDIQTQIAKFKEYCQSLISEAVTGKIDVRDFILNTEGVVTSA